MTDARGRYRDVLKILARQFAILEAANADAELVECYRSILRHLATQKEPAIDAILARNATGMRSHGTHDAREFADMPLSEVAAVLARPGVPRRTLEELALHRFALTRGEISKIPNRETLLQRLQRLVQNERTHDVIGRIAAGQASVDANLVVPSSEQTPVEIARVAETSQTKTALWRSLSGFMVRIQPIARAPGRAEPDDKFRVTRATRQEVELEKVSNQQSLRVPLRALSEPWDLDREPKRASLVEGRLVFSEDARQWEWRPSDSDSR